MAGNGPAHWDETASLGRRHSDEKTYGARQQSAGAWSSDGRPRQSGMITCYHVYNDPRQCCISVGTTALFIVLYICYVGIFKVRLFNRARSLAVALGCSGGRASSNSVSNRALIPIQDEHLQVSQVGRASAIIK